jgi:hypothetical protein
LYGAGFYYIPGTDTCIKIGGFVRAEWMHQAGGSFTPSTSATFDREFSDTQNRVRAAVTLDARSQTEYGTLRSYTQMGWNVTNGGTDFFGGTSSGATSTTSKQGSIYTNRAFIQLAGFTAGLASSSFDMFSFAAYSNQTNYIGSDVGGGGINVVAYTAQLGNGLSASVAIEDPITRRTSISIDTSGYGGQHLPDFTANLRVDQAWGSAQVMGAIHEVYPGQIVGLHNDNKYGFAVGAGVKFNLPMLGKGDNIAAQVVYGKGATGYNIRAAAFSITRGGNTVKATAVDDAVCSATALGCELTETWSVVAGYQHGWNSRWKTSLYGGYTEANYSSTAEGYRGATAGGLDYSFWQMGSRTVWTPVANLDLSVDVMYNRLDGSALSQVGADSTADVWSGIVRAQRNFWP